MNLNQPKGIMSHVRYALAALLFVGAGCVSAPSDSSAPALSETPQSISQPDQAMVPTNRAPGILSDRKIQNKQVSLQTPRGEIVFELFPDTAPLAVSNFVSLAEMGFYDDVIFHRREEGFVIQGGDPLGTGRGGPGYTFEDELDDSYTYERGIVAMANRGPNTNGSQFFIMLADATQLPKAYTIFGRVTKGMDVVDAIQIGDAMTKVTIEDKK